MAQAERLKGVVKWFSGQKGFGFITPDNGSEDLFVHQKSIRSQGFRTLLEGEVVEFVIGRSEDGRTKAVDVSGPNRSYVSGGNGGRESGSGGGDRGISSGFGRRIVSNDSYERGYGSYGRSHGRGGSMGGGYGRSGTGTGTTTGGGCYNCGRTGHMARDCYQGTDGSGGGGGGRSSGVSSRGGGYNVGGRGCYNCGEKGHLARECPNHYQQE